MPTERFTVEVQPDFIERQAKARPIDALAEIIWNGLDADATTVSVRLGHGQFGLSSIAVTDNGHGIPRSEASTLFTRLGGSWKQRGGFTKTKRRMLHGYEGRGRFKVFALGRVADWHVTYRPDEGKALKTYDISMLESSIREVRISDEKPAPDGARTGVEVTVSELHRDFRSLEPDTSVQELSEIFALYLKDYRDAKIAIEGMVIDPASGIASTKIFALHPVKDEDKTHPAELEIIEWRSATKRALYLCNEQGFPLSKVDTRFHVGGFQFSAYLKSPFIGQLHENNALEVAEMNPQLAGAIEEAHQTIKDYFRDRSAEQARAVVEEWKSENIYPYEGEAKSPIETAERKVFDIVASSVNDYLQDFAAAPPKNKALHLRMLRSAIERSPEDLQLILREVIQLPQRKQEELAKLLREASLSSIISAAKIVADRLKFLSALESIVFDPEMKQRLKERTQLHKILADNTWIFGEEFNLSVSDRSLTEVLRQHRNLLGDDIVIDEPVKHVSKTRGIVDLMLSRALRRHRANELDHLVVELKAPKVKLGKKEITQVEEYAISVANDERFRTAGGVTWTFWALPDEIDHYGEFRMKQGGIVQQKGNITIGIKTWAQIIQENKARLQFFQEKLEHQVDQGTALSYLQEKYEAFLTGVITEAPLAEQEEGGTTEPS
jgi:Histidine kinase-, DNA gyrase B-, and HSP90-like ATPase